MSFFRGGKARQSKLGNTASNCGKHSHRSKLESSVCALLQTREIAGEIKILQTEDHVYLTDARILYIPDWRCEDIKTGEIFWVEAKGMEQPTWKLKKKLWKFYGPGLLQIFKGTYLRPVLDEELLPPPKGLTKK